MSGLDKIIGHITADASEEVKTILDKANAEAEGIKSDAERKAAAECDKIAKKAEADVAAIIERGKSSAELKTRQMMLGEKQKLINETVYMAKDRLESMDDKAYTEFITALFAKHMPSKDACLKFGAADIGRIPQDVLDGFVKKAGDAGIKLTVSGEDQGIKNGFILDYGEIEENCTIDALIDQSIDDLQDKVKAILFA